jgi:hypothetical protein
MKTRIFGYWDNEVIINGFLVPIYQDIVTNYLYYHSLCEKNQKIVGFVQVDGIFKDDVIKKIRDTRKRSVGDYGYFVVKTESEVISGNYTEIKKKLGNMIANKKISSKNLIKQFENLIK